MKKYLLFFLFSISIASYSQELLMDTEDVHPADVIEAKFNGGGLDKFNEYIHQELDLSKITKSGKIVASFTINQVGEIKNIRILEFSNVESASEIIRVLQKAPKWEPAKRSGKPFSVDIKWPFAFTINSVPDTIKNQNPVSENPVSIENKKKIPGGLHEFYKFVRENYHAPDVPGLNGKVIISFVVNEDGSLSDYKIINDLGYGSAKELIRVLKSSGKKWSPAVKDGKPVKSTLTLPIRINIPRD